jgi:hypothetical protein
MRKLFALPFETVHVLGMALFFGVALILTLLTAPDWLPTVGKMSPETASRHFQEVASVIGRNGLWVACAALACGVLAPYARGDGKKLLSWIRVVCAGSAVVIVLFVWGGFESLPSPLAKGAESNHDVAEVSRDVGHGRRWRSDKTPTPWNALLAATGLNLMLGAFQISGGAAKKAKAESADKRK